MGASYRFYIVFFQHLRNLLRIKRGIIQLGVANPDLVEANISEEYIDLVVTAPETSGKFSTKVTLDIGSESVAIPILGIVSSR